MNWYDAKAYVQQWISISKSVKVHLLCVGHMCRLVPWPILLPSLHMQGVNKVEVYGQRGCLMVHSDFHHLASATSADASLLLGYPLCTHKYLQRAKLLWKTSISRWRLMYSDEAWMHQNAFHMHTNWNLVILSQISWGYHWTNTKLVCACFDTFFMLIWIFNLAIWIFKFLGEKKKKKEKEKKKQTNKQTRPVVLTREQASWKIQKMAPAVIFIS